MSMLSRFSSLAAPATGIQYVGGYATSVGPSISDVTVTFGGNLTGGLASSASTGDLVLVYFGAGSTTKYGLTVSGYTPVSFLDVNDTFDTNLVVSYKISGVATETSVTLVGGTQSTSDAGVIAIQVWRGVDQYLPLDVAAVTATGTNSVLCNPPAITPANQGAVIVAGGVGAHSRGVQTYSSSDLSSFITSGCVDSTNDATIGLGYTVWTSGSFNPAAFTFTGTDSTSFSWAAVTLALRPAGTQTGPFLISQTYVQNTSVTSSTVSKPLGTREGDLMIATMATTTSTGWSGATGWTEVADQITAAPSLRVAYKVATASEPSSYSFTSTSAGTHSSSIVTYRNAAYDAIGSITTGANPLVVGAVTASVDFSRIFATAARNAGSVTITTPAEMQAIYNDNGTTAPSRLNAQDSALSFAGSSGTRSFGLGSSTEVAGVLVSVKPAASYTKYAQYIEHSTIYDSAGSATVSAPNRIVPGNLLLLVASIASSSTTDVTVATPSGWSLLSGNSTASTAYRPGIYVFYRIADETDNSTASYTATASASVPMYLSVYQLAGVNPLTLRAGTINTGSSTTNITASGVTATSNGLLLYVGLQANNNQGVVTFTPPSGMTEITDQGAINVNPDISFIAAYQEGLSAGATGDKTATASAALGTNGYGALLVTVDAL